MVERGISLARTLFAFNSVNVEGWALYAEAEMVPYEPIDGQLIALQFRLFYGYTRILELRMETELALGDRFDRLAFNNFLLDQGLLPPDQLAEAVRSQFIPAHAGK